MQIIFNWCNTCKKWLDYYQSSCTFCLGAKNYSMTFCLGTVRNIYTLNEFPMSVYIHDKTIKNIICQYISLTIPTNTLDLTFTTKTWKHLITTDNLLPQKPHLCKNNAVNEFACSLGDCISNINNQKTTTNWPHTFISWQVTW